MTNCQRTCDRRPLCGPDRRPTFSSLRGNSRLFDHINYCQRPTCRRVLPSVPSPVPCPKLDNCLNDSTIEAMRSKLEEIEPRISCVGDKLQRVTDDVQKFRDHMTCRRREVEDLESTMTERIGKAEEQFNCHARECTENRTTSSSDSIAMRQALTNIVSEICGLKNYVVENLRQISARLDARDDAFDRFQEEITRQILIIQEELLSRENSVCELRFQVESKFSAIQAALRRRPRRREPCCEMEPGEQLLDTVTMTVHSEVTEEPEDTWEERPVVRRKCCRKRSDSTPRTVEVVVPETRRTTPVVRVPSVTAAATPAVRKKKLCKYPRTKKESASAEIDSTAVHDVVTSEADRLLDQMRKDSKQAL